MYRFLVLITAFFVLSTVPTEAQTPTRMQRTQSDFQIGPVVGMDLGDIQDPYVGLNARIATQRFPLVINPTFDYYFIGEQETFWSLSTNLLYQFGDPLQRYRPYTGIGLGLYRYSRETVDVDGPFREGSTDVGVNFLLGLLVPTTTFSPFGEVKYTTLFSDPRASLFEFTGGVLIRF